MSFCYTLEIDGAAENFTTLTVIYEKLENLYNLKIHRKGLTREINKGVLWTKNLDSGVTLKVYRGLLTSTKSANRPLNEPPPVSLKQHILIASILDDTYEDHLTPENTKQLEQLLSCLDKLDTVADEINNYLTKLKKEMR